MTIALNLAPEVESSLLAEAQAVGLSLEEFLNRQLEALARGSALALAVAERITAPIDSDRWEREFDEWLDSFPQSPVLSEEALKRENWYPDRW
jgi:hypothetical protein